VKWENEEKESEGEENEGGSQDPDSRAKVWPARLCKDGGKFHLSGVHRELLIAIQR